MNTLKGYLQVYFGKSSFRPGQKEVIEAILCGEDVLAIWPTGAGKSLTYQLPAVILPGLTLVISPLIALMEDQVQKLLNLSIPAASLSSSNSPAENHLIAEKVKSGELKILFVAPERLVACDFLQEVEAGISLMAIDEAHCITQWGHDFRPEYLRLGEAVAKFKPRSLLALTATAAANVQKQITTLLGMRQPRTFTSSLNRSNLCYQAFQWPRDERLTHLQRFLRSPGELPAVVYCNRRKDAENTALFLKYKGFKASYYHAGLSTKERSMIQYLFLNGDIEVMTATIAFGMGIDKPNVRQVIHMAPPNSLEGYYQESGRAGRDGQASRCTLFYDYSDFEQILKNAAENTPDQQTLEKLYQALHSYPAAELRPHFLSMTQGCWQCALNALYGRNIQAQTVATPRLSLEVASGYFQNLRQQAIQRAESVRRYAFGQICRRNLLLGYFGEELPAYCNNCDNCLNHKEAEENAKAGGSISHYLRQLQKSCHLGC